MGRGHGQVRGHGHGRARFAAFGGGVPLRRGVRYDYDDAGCAVDDDGDIDGAGVAMKTFRFAALDKDVSAVGLDAQYLHPDNRRHNFAMLDAFVAAGGSYVDSAEVYGIAEDRGMSERAVGQWLAARPGVRERVVLATKGLIPGYYGNLYREDVVMTPEAVHRSIDDSLARLGVRYLDVWMFHRDSPELPVGPLVDALDEEIRRGRVRAYGACNWRVARIVEAMDYARAAGKRAISLTSPVFSLAKPNEEYFRGTVSVDDADFRWLAERKFPVVAWAPLGRGFFTIDKPVDVYDSGMARVFYSDDNFERKRRVEVLAAKKNRGVADIALGYVISQAFPAVALVGAQSLVEVEDVVAAGDVQLSRAECQWLNLETDRRPFR